MAKLIREKQHIEALENFIDQAKVELVFFCPYFKLHRRLKDRLEWRKNDNKLRLVVVFGKNPDDPGKSLSKEDFDFLKEFPYITIKYHKRLHAKYYANEKEGMITSLNLHSYSIDNNIEVGVLFRNKGVLKNLADSAFGNITEKISNTENIAKEAFDYFIHVYMNAELVFEKESRFESKFFGLQKTYIGSEILTDNSSLFFKEQSPEKQSIQTDQNNLSFNRNTSTSSNKEIERPAKGYCIRTGQTLPFNPAKPLSYEAFQSWAKYENQDYPEKFCHCCGKGFRTTLRNPLCTDCHRDLYLY